MIIDGSIKRPRLRLAAALLMAFPVIGAGTPHTALAQSDGYGGGGQQQQAPAPSRNQRGGQQQQQQQQNLVLTEKVFKAITEANKAIEEKRFAQAMPILQDLLRGNLTPYERAIVLQTQGFVHTEQDDYRRGAESFEQALALNILPESQQHSLMYNLAQLYLATDQFQKSIEKFKAWFKVAQNPQPEAYVAFASAYAQMEDFRSGIPLLETGIKNSANPKKEWYDLLTGMYFETKNFPKVAETLEITISKWPSEKRYYTQLAGIYSELKKEKETLAMMELAYKAGFLEKSEELVQLAQLWMYHDNPVRGAVLLEAEIQKGRIKQTKDNFELLANAWIGAREVPKSIQPLARAAELSDDGETYVRLAQAYLEKEDWKNAVEALERAVQKGKLKNAGQVYLLEGVAYVNLERYEDARKAFTRATEFGQVAKPARQWLQHVEKVQMADAATVAAQQGQQTSRELRR